MDSKNSQPPENSPPSSANLVAELRNEAEWLEGQERDGDAILCMRRAADAIERLTAELATYAERNAVLEMAEAERDRLREDAHNHYQPQIDLLIADVNRLRAALKGLLLTEDGRQTGIDHERAVGRAREALAGMLPADSQSSSKVNHLCGTDPMCPTCGTGTDWR